MLLTARVEQEPRADFVKRLRRTVNWMSENARDHMRGLCTNQKKRAMHVIELDGARCRWYAWRRSIVAIPELGVHLV